MDQVKEILRQAIKYRFWILVGVSMLMPIAAYFSASGKLSQAYAQGETEVKSADTEVKKYVSGTFPNAEYKTLTDQRTDVLSRDVRAAWAALYEQQAPLLSWPPEVEPQLKEWGITKWPEQADDALVRDTIMTYIQVYPEYVDKVYLSFDPFDYIEGTGVVAAPPKEGLLRPAKFSQTAPPTYGKMVAAQQKLWIQGTVLDVVKKVNGTAKDWDEAILKEILALEVANPNAQDQRSIAKGETLELAPELVKPGSEAEVAAPAAGMGGSMMPGMEDMPGADMDMYGGMRGYAMGMGMGMGTTKPEDVYLFQTDNPEAAYRVAPVYLAVLIDQAHLLDVFQEFKRSPMAIQVVDFEMKRPSTAVKKPVKGEQHMYMYGMFGMPGGEAFLGARSMMDMMPGMMPGDMGMMAGYSDMMMPGMMPGMMPDMMGYGMGAAVPKRTGVRVAEQMIEKAKKAAAEKKAREQEKKLQRPEPPGQYFNIVELHVYGQARFYNPPPPEEPLPEPEPISESVPAEADPAMTDTEKAEAEPAKAETESPKAEPAPAEPAKADTVPTEPAQAEEPPKSEAPADTP